MLRGQCSLSTSGEDPLPGDDFKIELSLGGKRQPTTEGWCKNRALSYCPFRKILGVVSIF